MTTTSGFLGLSTRGLARALNWAPTLTAHDPNPPLPLESPPPSTFGGEELHAAPVGRSWAVAFAVLPVFAFGAEDELPTYTPPSSIVDESDAPARLVWPQRHLTHTAYDDGAPTEWDLPARSRLTLELDFTDTSTLTLTGSLIDAVADQSGYGRDFTQTGDNRPTSRLDGILGQAATFIVDGSTDDWMESTATVANLTNASEWTIVARIRVGVITSGLSSTYGDGVIFPFGVSGPGIHLRSDGAGDDRAYAINEDGGWPPDECYVSIDRNVELILVAKLESGTLSIQIGTGTPATVSSGNVSATTETWRLGVAPGGGNWLDGAIGNVLAWDKALSSSEITSLLEWFEARKPKRGWLEDHGQTQQAPCVARLIGSHQHHQDEVPVVVAGAALDDDLRTPVVVWVPQTYARTVMVDDDLPISAAVVVDEEQAPARPTWAPNIVASVVGDDDPPAGALRGCAVEDYAAPGMGPPWPRLGWWSAVVFADDDVPSGSLYGCPVEDHPAPLLSPPMPRLTWWDRTTFSDDDVPAGELHGCLFEEPGPALQVWVGRLLLPTAWVDDDLAQAPTVAAEEDGGALTQVVWVGRRLLPSPVEQDQDPAGALHGCLYDEVAGPTAVWAVRVVAPEQSAGDEQFPVLQAPAFDDAAPVAVAWRAPCATALAVQDEIIPGPEAAYGFLADDVAAAPIGWLGRWFVDPVPSGDEWPSPVALPCLDDGGEVARAWARAPFRAAVCTDDDLPSGFAAEDDPPNATPWQAARWSVPQQFDEEPWRTLPVEDHDTAQARCWPLAWSLVGAWVDGGAPVETLADDDQGLTPPCPWPMVFARQPHTDDALCVTIPGVPFVATLEGRDMTGRLEGETMTATLEGGSAVAVSAESNGSVSLEGRAFNADLEGRR